ncbi:MAG TPA: LysM peptidoglycan-binding domain-containing protein [Candidatus Hydrothermia bacterium]|nr:LysM peptidoglycan-binding domain-containing protein [Candidatus Hydrothermae bacterium]MDD3649699.1 LysM peptidoglycan-binding domain-containing protein [Candidatus Hydrothermia bacterium]MDD5573230.1 LysM peptidoglycan-binding domain-containing protein [Candidatus Hydrothermia bacterium]HOK23607.1 LysM peptidoglycan-binding domain-containing protein [Candidatus Hydrothermia bacterium]HOL24343.1 LysM peptidoglycan-binding domain-containing protein [Candidatus Hydrothermia bacterium]
MSRFIRVALFIVSIFSCACGLRKSYKNTVPQVEFTFADFEPDGGFAEDSTAVENIPQKFLQEELSKVETEMKGRLAHFGLVLTEEEEMEIAKWHYYYNTRGKGKVAKALTRGAPYLGKISEIIKSYGLPEDLKYLPIIESGYNVEAVSRKKAVGPWQFMSFTAKKYGLKVDWWIDERRDPIYSTHAACQYLKDLYELFGRWDLAIAAYNAGEGKVYSKLVKTNGEKFWDIRRELKRETRNYVPSFLALIMFINGNRDFVDSILNVPEFTYDSVLVPAQANIKQLASWAGISEAEFKKLNPHFHRFATPPYLENYYVRIPIGTKEQFITHMNKTPKDQWFKAQAHVVKKGETLSQIARRYGVTVSAIRQANNNVNPYKLRPGMVLIIPHGGTSYYASSKSSKTSQPKVSQAGAANSKASGASSNIIRYKVKKGDTLYSLSKTYGVSINDLKRWNNLPSSKIRIGQVIVIHTGQS